MTRSTACHRISACLLTLFLTLSASAVASAAEKTVNETYPLSPEGRISLSNINGDVSIVGWDRSEVSLEAVIRSRSQEAVDEVELDIEASDNRLRIEVDHKSHGRRHYGKEWADVDFTLKVPKGAELREISLVNGSLDLRGLDGEIEASLVNGNLEGKELGGSVELSTVNGSLDVTLESMTAGQHAELESVNGSIDLRLPADANAEVEASTVHGRIRNEFGLKVDNSGWVGSELEGRIGDGAGRVSLENVNGSIDIRR